MVVIAFVESELIFFKVIWSFRDDVISNLKDS